MHFACSMISATIPTITHYLYLSFGKNFNKIETRAEINFPPPAMQGAHEISRHLRESLGEDAPSYTTDKYVCLVLGVMIFPPFLRLVLHDPKIGHPGSY